MRTGGKILVDQLSIHGTEKIFCVPGESYLEILDALYDTRDKIKVFNARHEAGAANMAEAYGKLTGQPGIALVTRGPGACHASVGIHIAKQDSTPMILLIGQVSQKMINREAFQEIDYQSMFGKIAKWVVQIEATERIPEYISKAFRISCSGRPGPVVLALPENILTERTDAMDVPKFSKINSPLGKNEAVEIKEMIQKSIKPLIIVGGSGWKRKSGLLLTKFAQEYHIPVSTSFRRQDIIDNTESIFAGSFGTSVSPTLIKRTQEADLLIVLGARLGEMTTAGFTTVSAPKPKQSIIHIYQDFDEIGSVFYPELGFVCSMAKMAKALLNLSLEKKLSWSSWCKELNGEYLEDLKPPQFKGKLDLGLIFQYLNKELQENVIISLDAGNHTGWPQRFFQYSSTRRQLGSTCGSMGYSIPAAIAASLEFPEKLVIGCVGDGGFIMSGLELMTAIQHNARPIIIIFNNFSYGTIRMHQERDHPKRKIATDLVNPNFVELALSMGAHAERVEKTEEFSYAFSRCLKAKKVSVLELITDQDQITTRDRLEK